jgi:hypothetical protein
MLTNGTPTDGQLPLKAMAITSGATFDAWSTAVRASPSNTGTTAMCFTPVG